MNPVDTVSWSDPLAGYAVVLGVLFAGAGLLRRVRYRAATGPEAVGVAFVTGAAWLGAWVTALALLGSIATPYVLCALLLAAALAPWLPPRTRPEDRGAPRAAVAETSALAHGWLGFLPALAVVALSLWFAVQRPVWNIDSERRWTMHAQWLAEYDTPVPARVEDESWAHTHPTYPPLVTALAGLALQLGNERDMGLRPLFPFFFLALLGVLYGWAREVAGARASPWITLAFALTPCFAHAGGTGMGADAALGDVPLAACLTVFSVLLLRALRAARPGAGLWWAAGFAAVAAVSTKKEGTAFGLAMIALTAVWILAFDRGPERRARLAGVARIGAAVLAVALLWRLASRHMPVEAGEDYLSGGALVLLGEQLGRLPTILARLGEELATHRIWGVLWALPALWLVRELAAHFTARRAGRARDAYALLPGAWLLLGLLTVCAAYVTTGWQGGNYEGLMKVSMTRLVMHHAPLVALMACALFAAPREGEAV